MNPAAARRREFRERLVDNSWKDLADELNIPAHERTAFDPGDEAREILLWAEIRQCIHLLPDAVVACGRKDLHDLVLKIAQDYEASRPRSRGVAPIRSMRTIEVLMYAADPSFADCKSLLQLATDAINVWALKPATNLGFIVGDWAPAVIPATYEEYGPLAAPASDPVIALIGRNPQPSEVQDLESVLERDETRAFVIVVASGEDEDYLDSDTENFNTIRAKYPDVPLIFPEPPSDERAIGLAMAAILTRLSLEIAVPGHANNTYSEVRQLGAY